MGDNPERLCSSIKQAVSRADIVITTGGLGPTVDDITTESISKAVKKPLVFNKQVLEMMRALFVKRRMRMPADNRKQAYIPEGAKWLRNELGTAPGLIIESAGRFIIALPGPPRELKPMFEKHAMPFLKKISPAGSVILTRTLKTTGFAESQLHPKVKGLLKLSGNTTVGIYAHPSQVELKITAKAANTSAAKKKSKKPKG